MSGLTTHILDSTHGQPASNVKIDLYVLNGNQLDHLKTVTTNSDGRLDYPLLSKEEIQQGNYEIVFHIGAYFRELNNDLKEPLFLDSVPVRFGVSDKEAHYHVPLLVSPWGYQVYRGS
ncbi:hydroxyisourate hydrolase [Aquibacillus halophilus]|uniref:5-hydroxyisourate hydrolase n=1 Tax=Aquibacillus halophilus TaxID=930132 RepID=A0A6A8DF56_9BACI|nr:hydroxyisourate hydrolase [Aquibacillus halophilus]MRH44335.1 hydroxyisourate hydrolase [Aquibacillus halophilus]